MNANTLFAGTPHAVFCPTCKAEPAADCVTPSGATAAKFHVARERALDSATEAVTEALAAEETEKRKAAPAVDFTLDLVEIVVADGGIDVPPHPLVPGVRAHAEKFVYQNGWDILVETMTDEDIIAIIGRARTVKGAVIKARKHTRLLDAARREIQSA